MHLVDLLSGLLEVYDKQLSPPLCLDIVLYFSLFDSIQGFCLYIVVWTFFLFVRFVYYLLFCKLCRWSLFQVEICLLVLILLHAVACECFISFIFYLIFVHSFMFVPTYENFHFNQISNRCRYFFVFEKMVFLSHLNFREINLMLLKFNVILNNHCTIISIVVLFDTLLI